MASPFGMIQRALDATERRNFGKEKILVSQGTYEESVTHKQRGHLWRLRRARMVSGNSSLTKIIGGRRPCAGRDGIAPSSP